MLCSAAAARRLAIVAVIVAGAAPAATAQVNPGPFAGLFGQTPERVGKEWNALDFRSGVGAGYDNALFTASPFGNSDAPTHGGQSGLSASASLAFDRHTNVSNLTLSISADYHEYLVDPSSYGATTTSAGVSYGFKPTTKVTVHSSASFTRQPYFVMLPQALFRTPDWIVPVPSTPFAAFMQLNDGIYGEAGIQYGITRHTTFGASVMGEQSRLPEYPDSDIHMVGASANISHRISRDLSVRLGYSRSQYHSDLEQRGDLTHEYIDAGVDYSRSFSVARRTTFGFSTSTSMVRSGGLQQFRVEGSAELAKSFARTWRASLSAQRSTQFLPGIFEPLFYDSATAALGGMLNTRLQWFALGGFSQGAFGLQNYGEHFRSTIASTRLSVALTRHLGSYVQYSYLKQLPSETAVLPVPVTPVSRQSVMVGFNVWVPIFQNVRAASGPE